MTTGLKASDAAAIATAVVGTPGVARLSRGGAVEVATYLPGNRVRGVHVHGDDVEVHVVAQLTARSLPELAAAIRRNVMTRFPDVRQVSVTIDDLESDEPVDRTARAIDIDALQRDAAIEPGVGPVPAV